MVETEYKIAVASSDGIVVNNHFGHAKTFYIFALKNDQIEHLETRQLEPVCETGNHDEARLKANVERLSDCTHLLAVRIGNGARVVLESYGISCYEIPGVISESIDKLVKYEKVNELFK